MGPAKEHQIFTVPRAWNLEMSPAMYGISVSVSENGRGLLLIEVKYAMILYPYEKIYTSDSINT